jgi:hypothetical protein
MNERIRELAADARGQMVVLTTVDEELWKQHEEFVEKFAELIVEECASLFPLTFTDEQYQRRIDKTIRKHFGNE